MKVDVIAGLQWGDEGKGKVVDVFAARYDVIARFQGGPNAGHTLEFEGKKHVLHTIPSGIFHRDKINLIGNGVIIDPRILVAELRKLDPHGVDYHNNLFIARRAHLILPTHRLLDACYEQQKGDAKIGSTLKGIGPAYTDKTARNGLRVGDLESRSFMQRYENLREYHLLLIEAMGSDPKEFTIEGLTMEAYEMQWLQSAEELKGLNLVDGEFFINDLIRKGKRVLAEGAQGTMLDVDFGSYPFVTSSNTITAGVCTGLGIAPQLIGEVYGVFKAYCTRVGSGPFPTELHDETGELLRKNGNEYGSTTGRPRRCGWIDLPALKYACMLNGVTQLVMTKADVMNDFPVIRLCHTYELDGEPINRWGFFCDYGKPEPRYREVDGWLLNLGNITSSDNIPPTLSRYTGIITRETGVPVTFVSTGPDRSQIIAL
ncbi:MAG TPA: adenylosuccinate synthase [Bacteroidales bacterium]|nr:adenylosuccinate synthase [Bacteroidales bacterium]HRZ49673.1 adenylosuccinate synthase [Bacteroidales bacterium]